MSDFYQSEFFLMFPVKAGFVRHYFGSGLCIAALAVAIAGCGGPSATPAANDTVAIAQSEMKLRLDDIAKTGYTGSALEGMREGLEKLGKPDMLKDYDRLEAAKTPDAAKKIAAEMSAKL